MTNEDVTATGRPHGNLIGAREARALIKCSATTLRTLLAAGFGPPGFKRPGSNRWLFWSGEVLDCLETNYRRAAA
jgi:hypothetical protein